MSRRRSEQTRPGPQLHSLLVADDPQSWTSAGFTLHQADEESGDTETSVIVGSIQIRFQVSSNSKGIVGWAFHPEPAGTQQRPLVNNSIDGIPTSVPCERLTNPITPGHPNGASHIDHVVVTTPNLTRTIDALESAGFEVSRSRYVPDSDQRQVFLWAGETILEVVGSVTEVLVENTDPSAFEPAKLWGLAITTDSLDEAVKTLGSALGEPKDAVQPGRRTATIATKRLGISVPMILLTPHISSTKAD